MIAATYRDFLASRRLKETESSGKRSRQGLETGIGVSEQKTPSSAIRDSKYYANGCVAFNLRRATRIVTRRYEDALRPVGMKAFQFTALAALSEHIKLPQLIFADFVGMDVSTLNRNVRAMEGKGWIKYIDDPEDRRKKHVMITDDGRRAFEQAAPLWEKAQAETKAMMKGYDWTHERAWLGVISQDSTPTKKST